MTTSFAIEGRRHHWESTLEPRLHSACVFEPKQVRHFSSLLEKVDEVKLREQLDFSLMDQMDLPVEYWEEEGEETFSEYILPLFEQLKELYRAAAESGQHVIFWWT